MNPRVESAQQNDVRRKRRRSHASPWVLLLGPCIAGLGAAQIPEPIVQWSALARARLAPGEHACTALLEVTGTIRDGWHVYALSEPPGGPTALRVTLDENSVARAAGAPSGTKPHKRHDPSFGLETRFYTGSFTIRVPLQVDLPAAAGKLAIPVSVRFQTCSDRECQPPSTVHLSFVIDAPADGADQRP